MYAKEFSAVFVPRPSLEPDASDATDFGYNTFRAISLTVTLSRGSMLK